LAASAGQDIRAGAGDPGTITGQFLRHRDDWLRQIDSDTEHLQPRRR
jgi:hypothetical protein